MDCINEWQIALIVLLAQIGFLYLRTLNIRAVAQGKVWKAVLTGNGIATCWLITTTISVSSMMQLEFLPIAAHLLGGTVGTIMGMKSDVQRKKVE